MPTRNVRGTTLFYGDVGKGPPLVLVHGFPLDSRMWEAQVAGLSDSHRVITPELRGFGQSKCEDAFTLESLADDLHALLAELGALPCTLAGLSMGGYVSLAYARKYPADLQALILVDTRAEADATPAREGRDKMIAMVRKSGACAIADEMMGKLIADETVCHRPQVVSKLRDIMENCPPATIEHALKAMRDRPDQIENLASIPVPTLILVGDSDRITPIQSAEAMKQRIPRSRLEVIRGAGHMSPMEQPTQVTREMQKFLRDVEADHPAH